MPDERGNVRFDSTIHDWTASLVACALNDLDSVAGLVDSMYPNLDAGHADRARQQLRTAAVALREVQRALGALSVEETGSRGRWPVLPGDAPLAGDTPPRCSCTIDFKPDDRVESERNPSCPQHGDQLTSEGGW